MIPILRILLKLYKATASPFFTLLTGGPGTGCRYEPTCSEYLVQAVEIHGMLSGSWIGIKRVCRCHPWGGSGFDPVPVKSSPRHHVT